MLKDILSNLHILEVLLLLLPIILWVKFEFFKRFNKKKQFIYKIKEIGIFFTVILLSFAFLRLFFFIKSLFLEMNWMVFFGSGFFALLPVLIWIKLVYTKRLHRLHTKKQRRRELWLLIIIFILGALTVPILSYFYEYLVANPSINYYKILGDIMVAPHSEILQAMPQDSPSYTESYTSYTNAKITYDTLTISIDALLEEIIKLSILVYFLRIMGLVKTIGDAIVFSILAGLGYAFIENMVFFADVYSDTSKDIMIFANVVIFRSIVLSIGHMTFSGIFGYFYGLSKFALPVYEEKKWEGCRFPLLHLVSWIFRIPMNMAYSSALMFEGVILAMLTHTTFNLFLGFGIRDYAIYFVLITAIYVYYLTQHKAGHMVLASFKKKHMSMMAPKDEDVVLELAGMWINEGKYKEVEEICERLTKKDPDNPVIKLLYAKAHDKRRVKRAKLAVAALFFQDDIFEDDVSIFEKFNEVRKKKD